MPKFKTKDVTPIRYWEDRCLSCAKKGLFVCPHAGARRNFLKNVPSSSILYLASCMAVSTKAVNADIYDYLKNYSRMIVE